LQHLQASGDQGIPVPYQLALSSTIYTGMENSWGWDASMTSSRAIGMVTQVGGTPFEYLHLQCIVHELCGQADCFAALPRFSGQHDGQQRH
jgi:hypothetical protein